MKWKIIESDRNSEDIFRLPRKVGFEINSNKKSEYHFSYLNSSSLHPQVHEVDGAKIAVEKGSQRILWVMFDSHALPGSLDERMKSIIQTFFGLDGRIDPLERKFLSVLEEQVVKPKTFG